MFLCIYLLLLGDIGEDIDENKMTEAFKQTFDGKNRVDNWNLRHIKHTKYVMCIKKILRLINEPFGFAHK